MLKKTLGLIAVLLLVLVGEVYWLSQSDLQGKWMSLVEDSVTRPSSMYDTSSDTSDFGEGLFDESSEPGTEFMPGSNPIATLGNATGTVTILRDGETLALSPFMALMTNDQIKTGADGKAEIAWTGYGRTIIAENSSLTIVTANQGENSDGLVTRLKLESGRIWTRLEQLLSNGSSFEVKASNVVATVRGTSFGVDLTQQGRVELRVAESNVDVSRTATPDSDEVVGTPVRMGAMQRMAMAELDTALPQPIQMSEKEMQADTFLMEGNLQVPQEYMDMEWMAFVELILSQIPPEELPADFDRAAFMEYMRQVQQQIPDEVKQQYMQEYSSGMYSN